MTREQDIDKIVLNLDGILYICDTAISLELVQTGTNTVDPILESTA
jgi:hypothetical protein